MSRPKTAQELIHWLEEGAGARWVALAAILAVTVALSLRLAWVQFHGAASEATMVQADTGRQLAAGQGFTTLVNYPQTAAFLAQRGVNFDKQKPYPELHQAPLYSIVIAASLRVLPAGAREKLFSQVAVPPGGGFAADYFLLGLNLLLLWLAAFFAAGWLYVFRSPAANRLRWTLTAALVVLLATQAVTNSGEYEHHVAGWMAPLVIIFGAGFFFVLLGSNAAYCCQSVLLPACDVALSSARASLASAGPSLVSPSVTARTALQGRDTIRSPASSGVPCTTSPRPSGVDSRRTGGVCGSAPAERQTAANRSSPAAAALDTRSLQDVARARACCRPRCKARGTHGTGRAPVACIRTLQSLGSRRECAC